MQQNHHMLLNQHLLVVCQNKKNKQAKIAKGKLRNVANASLSSEDFLNSNVSFFVISLK